MLFQTAIVTQTQFFSFSIGASTGVDGAAYGETGSGQQRFCKQGGKGVFPPPHGTKPQLGL